MHKPLALCLVTLMMLSGCISKQNQELAGKPVCTLDGRAFVVAPSAVDAVFLRRAAFADKLCQRKQEDDTDGR